MRGYKPLTALTVTVDIPSETDLLGKSVTDLQTGITLGKSAIRGELKYVDDYTGFSGNPAEQKGNYIALKCECEDADSIVVELVGGYSGPVTLDEDGIIVLKIAKNTQTVKVTANATGYEPVTKTYTLTGVKLDKAE